MGLLDTGIDAAVRASVPSGEEIDLERINAFESVLNPMIAEMGISQVWARRVKDAYVDFIFPVGADHDQILEASTKIQASGFEQFAQQHVKDIIEREFENGTEILQKIDDSFSEDPFAFFAANELSGDDISTLPELSRRTQEFVTLPDQLTLQQDRLINTRAPFLPGIPEGLQGRLRSAFRDAISLDAAEAGMSLEDFLTTNPVVDFKAVAEQELTNLFSDELFQSAVTVNDAGSTLSFILNNKAQFGNLTPQEMLEAVKTIALDDPKAGESEVSAEARSKFAGILEDDKTQETINDMQRARTLRNLEEDIRTFEEDTRLADIQREENARRLDFEDPFARAFETQAGKFLFGPQGRAVAQDISGEAIRGFEERINVTRDRVEGDTGERPSFQQLFSGEFPEVGTIEGFVQREFDADFFTESARRSRQSRSPSPVIGISRRSQPQTNRLGATGGR